MNGSTFYFDFEVSLMVWLQNLIGSVGGSIAGFVTMLGEELIYVALLGLLYWSINKRIGTMIGENLMLALLLNPMLKNIFVRRRPYFDHADIKCLKKVDSSADLYDIAAQGYSFPSGHSTNSAVVYGSLAVAFRKTLFIVIGIVLPLLVGLSRICLGVHYPTDVLVGWALGLLSIGIMALLRKLIKKAWLRYLIILLLTIPGCFYCTSHDYYTALGMTVGFFASQLFEARFVRFENTKNVLNMILRVLLGLLLFLGVNSVLKLLFGAFSDGEYLFRVLRYAIDVFVLMGVYPIAFRYIDRLFPRKSPAKQQG